jgi:hypothetical protein
LRDTAARGEARHLLCPRNRVTRVAAVTDIVALRNHQRAVEVDVTEHLRRLYIEVTTDVEKAQDDRIEPCAWRIADFLSILEFAMDTLSVLVEYRRVVKNLDRR